MSSIKKRLSHSELDSESLLSSKDPESPVRRGQPGGSSG